MPNIVIFHVSLDGESLEREPGSKELHSTRHILQAFCLKFYNNPLCYQDNEAKEKKGRPCRIHPGQPAQLGSLALRNLPSLHLSLSQAEVIAPSPCLPQPLCPHVSLWAVGSSRQGVPEQIQLLSISVWHLSESLASGGHSVTLQERWDE